MGAWVLKIYAFYKAIYLLGTHFIIQSTKDMKPVQFMLIVAPSVIFSPADQRPGAQWLLSQFFCHVFIEL
jgi:hypothetical protein